MKNGCFLAQTIHFWNVYCSSANVKNKYELLHLKIFQHVMYIIHQLFFCYDFPGVLNQQLNRSTDSTGVGVFGVAQGLSDFM